jgi:hypothetical protein
MSESRHLGTFIARPADEVYAYVADATHLPEWAAGLGSALGVRFVPPNEHLVLDHDVSLPDGSVTTNPMRVLRDGDGCEVVFTVRRAEGMSDEQLDADVAAVRADLERLTRLLEYER